MYHHWKYALLISTVCLFLKADFKDTSSDNGLSAKKFGPIAPRFTMVALRKGPKRRDCCQISFTTDDKFLSMEFKLVIPKDVEFLKTKSAIHFGNITNGAPDIIKWTDNLCQHFFFRPFLSAQFKINLKTCVVNKGIYILPVNATTMIHSFFGSQFFYGTYSSRTTILSKDCNIICIDVQFVLEKPKF